MSYTKYHDAWEDLPSEETPIVADALDHIEQGIYDAASTADAAQTDVDALEGTVGNIQTSVGTLQSTVSGIQTDVDNLEGTVSTLEDEVADITDIRTTVTGNPLTITATAMQNLAECEVGIVAQQDLNGYSKPWAGGSGKNLFDVSKTPSAIERDASISNGTVTLPNEYSTVRWNLTNLVPGTYTASCNVVTNPSSDNAIIQIVNLDGTSVDSRKITTSTGTIQVTFTVTDQTQMRINIYKQTAYATVTIDSIQIEKGSTATAYEPYENICEITGMSEVTVSRRGGKNLCASAITPSGRKYQYQSCLVCDAELESNTTYTISFVTQEGFKYYINENLGVGQDFTGTGARQSVTFTTKTISESTANQYDSSNGGWIVVKNSVTQSDVPIFTDVQIEKGSSATTYEPYKGKDYTFTIGSTCYGGSLNTKTGVLTVTHANIASYNGETINEPWLSSMDEYASGTTPTTGAQVVYPLSTATTITLTSQEIALISGENTLSTDADSITAVYQSAPDIYLAIGDSLETGYLTDSATTTGWGELLPRYFKEKSVFCSGVNGSAFCSSDSSRATTVTSFLEQLETMIGDMTDTEKGLVKKVIVGGGFNDIEFTSSENVIIGYITEFCDYVRSNLPKAEILVLITGWATDYSRRIAMGEIKRIYKKACAQNGAAFIDVSFASHKYDHFYTDGVHLLADGQIKLAECMANAIRTGYGAVFYPLTTMAITANGTWCTSAGSVGMSISDDNVTLHLYGQDLSFVSGASFANSAWHSIGTLPENTFIWGGDDTGPTVSFDINGYIVADGSYYDFVGCMAIVDKLIYLKHTMVATDNTGLRSFSNVTKLVINPTTISFPLSES